MAKDTTSGLIASALSSVTADASAVAILSPQSTVCIAAVTTTFEGMIGESLASIATDLAADLSNQMGSVMVDSLASCAEAIPFLGQVVAIAFVVVDAINAQEAAHKAMNAAGVKANAEMNARLTPVGTDAGQVAPCDIFGVYDAEDLKMLGLVGDEKGGGKLRPTLGQTLITLTEREKNQSGSWDRDWFLKEVNKPTVLQLLQQGKKGNALKAGGMFAWGIKDIPPARRQMFHKLRVAIEAQRKHEPRGSTDLGKSLWPVYLDLLLDEMNQGHLDERFSEILLGYYIGQVCDDISGAGAAAKVTNCRRGISSDRSTPLAAGLVQAVHRLAFDWKNKIQPWGATGAKDQAALAAQAAAIAEGIVGAATGKKPKRIKLPFKKGGITLAQAAKAARAAKLEKAVKYGGLAAIAAVIVRILVRL